MVPIHIQKHPFEEACLWGEQGFALFDNGMIVSPVIDAPMQKNPLANAFWK